MDSSYSTDRFKLDNLPKPNDRTSRPTIPYSQFPRPAVPHVSTSFEPSSRGRGVESVPNVTISASSTSPHHTDSPMDYITPSGHRRRRSSAMNDLEGEQHPQWRHDTQDNHKWDNWSEDGGRGSEDGEVSLTEDLESLLDDEGLNDDEETGLTEPERRRRKGKRRHNSMLNERIAGGSKMTQEDKEEADQHFLKRIAINGILIGLWYLFSLSISLYNTWMFSSKHLDFKFPLFTTSTHMVVQFALASLVLYFVPSFRPRNNLTPNEHNIHSTDTNRERHKEAEKRPLMTRWFYLTRLGPCGMATGLDIGLGNTSLKFIKLSFYTMCKSSSLAFVLMFAFLFRLESPSWRLIAIIATMTLGVIMMVFGEIEFSTAGFILVISASFFSGFRWGLTQILLLRNPATSNPFSSIFFLAPIMFATLFILALFVEGFTDLLDGIEGLIAAKGVILGPTLILFPGVIAFLMTASEFALLKRTSVVTLSIAGIFKEVVTIAAAGVIFDDRLTPINVSGLFVTIGAIAAYNYIKIQKMRGEELMRVKARSADVGMAEGGREQGARGLQEGEIWEMEERGERKEDRKDVSASSLLNSDPGEAQEEREVI